MSLYSNLLPFFLNLFKVYEDFFALCEFTLHVQI